MNFYREDWQRYIAAVDVIAQKFQTQVQVYQPGYGLRIDFKTTGLTGSEADALLVVEDLIEAISPFPAGYVQTLDLPEK